LAALLPVGAVGAIVTSRHEQGAEGRRFDVEGSLDAFDRPDDPATLGAVPGGPRWRADEGTWGVVGGEAAVTAPALTRDLAVVSLGRRDGAVQVRLTRASGGAGIVFRYRDPFNYWSVVAVPQFATWSVVKTVNGQDEAATGPGVTATGEGTTIGVRLRGNAIDVVIDRRVRRTIVDEALEGATGVGLVVDSRQPGESRFDDFRIERPGGLPVPAEP
jgi:hypothetical protein